MENLTKTNTTNNGKQLSPTLLTAETSLLLLVDYQAHVMKDIYSTDHELIELNGQARARAGKVFDVPVYLEYRRRESARRPGNASFDAFDSR